MTVLQHGRHIFIEKKEIYFVAEVLITVKIALL